VHLAFLHSSVQLAVTLHIASIVELSPQHFRAAQAHALASRPEMALSRQDVYSAAHCIIRPLLLFRKWEDVSRAIHMHNCTEAHPAPSVALEAPVELPPRASALAASHRAKAGGAVDRAEGCRRPSRGEVRAEGNRWRRVCLRAVVHVYCPRGILPLAK